MTATERTTLALFTMAAALLLVGAAVLWIGGDFHPGAEVAPATRGLTGAPAPPTSSQSGAGAAGEGLPGPFLGALTPGPGLLPAGTVTVTLSLTTSLPADCRWSDAPDTPYAQMTNSFSQGQGAMNHGALVSGLYDLADRWFYVRCAGPVGIVDPDRQEAQTHLRVLGPWGGGYPRIANLWPNYDPALGVDFFAGYDLFIPNWWPEAARPLDRLRVVNPHAKILLTQNATYGWPEIDPLTAEWVNSEPGDWGYPCLMRDSGGTILRVAIWGHPMYNLTQPQCRAALIRQNIEEFLSSDPRKGDNLAYDGIFWDLLNGWISWLGADIDADVDGMPDDLAQLDAVYEAGLQDLLATVRTALPNAVLMGNEAATVYAPWVNGRMFEWQLWTLADGRSELTWDKIVADYDEWSDLGQLPRTTFIQGAPQSLEGPQGNRSYDDMTPAMRAETAADYQRMRFGLTTALMGDGLYFFQYQPTRGQSFWYDEFGAPGDQAGGALPRGYLGLPTGEPKPLDDNPQKGRHALTDDAGFEAGSSGVWARSFDNGLAVVNASSEVRTVTLPGSYYKLDAGQAPLFQTRIDDDAIAASGGWRVEPASNEQFGKNVLIAAGGTMANAVYQPELAYGGLYHVLAWVTPDAGQSISVTVGITNTGGMASVILDQSTGEVGWRDLGVFPFEAGETAAATLVATGEGDVVADAFKWVSVARYNDGARVSQVTLLPQDGIILLTKSSDELGSPLYVPLIEVR